LAGTLYVCATPIGNLSDVTLRVLDVISRVDVVAAEDTRLTRKFLSHYNMSKNLISYHEHNRFRAGEQILGLLRGGSDVALVTDSGMPAISDPGQDLVAAAIEAGLDVQVIPGPNAALTALVLSGLSTDRFVFEGFLPRKGTERAERLEQLSREPRTVIIYESPQRVVKTLEDLYRHLGGERRCSLSREMTKKFEETIRGTVSSVLQSISGREVKGECVLVVAGAEAEESGQASEPARSDCVNQDLESMVRAYADAIVSAGSSRRDAAVRISAALGRPWRQIYRLITDVSDGGAGEADPES